MTPSERISFAGRQFLDRRRFLGDSASALGSIALSSLLASDNLLAAADPIRPLIDPSHPYAPRPPHFAPRRRTCSSSSARAL